jgi:ankyrin repeat protein
MQNDYPPLFYVASSGDLDEIRALAPDAEPLEKNQALAQAASLGQLEAAALLLELGADANGLFSEQYGTVLFPACERMNPDGIRFLLEHGADPRKGVRRRKAGREIQALDHLLASPERSPLKPRCIALLLKAGAEDPGGPAMAIHKGNAAALREALAADPEALCRPLDADYGRFPLEGATLLHLAVEYNEIECATELLRQGLDVNAKALSLPGTVRTRPVWPTQLVSLGEQSALFHAKGYAKESLAFLLERGADPGQRAPFLRNGKKVMLTPEAFFEEEDRIECNLLDEILTLRRGA